MARSSLAREGRNGGVSRHGEAVRRDACCCGVAELWANGNSMARLASIFDVRCDRGLWCQRHALAIPVACGVDDALWLFYAEDVLAFLMRSCRRGWASLFMSLRALLRPAVPCIRLAARQR